MSRVVVCTIGIGGTYPRLVARLLQRFAEHAPAIEIKAWVNDCPYGTPRLLYGAPVDGRPNSPRLSEYDYTSYAAKIFALDATRQQGADIGILVDASFFPVRDLQPMIDHIERNGYYLCRNGFSVGEWSSDRCLEAMGISRDDALTIEECSSYCVGLDFRNPRALEMLYHWCRYALDSRVIPGPHTAGTSGRNPGFVSNDPRVRGHRHDQTALSIIAHRMGLQAGYSDRPYLTAYALGYGGAFPNETTVLVNDGRLL